jgi:hypothetical protein
MPTTMEHCGDTVFSYTNVKTYKGFTKEQDRRLETEGDNPYEPRWIFKGDDGEIYYQKWNNRKPLKVSKWRSWIINEFGFNECIGLKDFF